MIKLISLPTKPPTSYHIVDLFKSNVRSYWYDSIFSNYDKIANYTTSSAPFLRSSFPAYTKILRPGIYFRVKTTDIDNQYDIYYRTFADLSSMLEGVDFTVSYTPVAGIHSLCIIIKIASV